MQVPYYDYALDLILDSDSASTEILTEEQHELVESAAEMLYGLIHVRFILTSRGMSAMFEKYKVTAAHETGCHIHSSSDVMNHVEHTDEQSVTKEKYEDQRDIAGV